ncbi:hypothetical protein [Spongiimicrobium salis]|uniref:hypothetical protein n=1 Tax=Spongiimicrobium salis TaxID=1667022 RepID=UPI00374CE8A8
MEEQELKNIWKHSSKTEEIHINTSQLLKDFKVGMEDRERIVLKRDRREIIGATIGFIGFGYSFYAYPYVISRIGAITGLVALVYIVIKLRNNRKSKLVQKLFLSIQEQLNSQKQFMLSQHKLLDTVIYWISIPIFIANALLIWGISKSEQPLTILEQLTIKWEFKLIATLIFALIFGYVGLINKKAAKANWKPLINQVDSIIKDLKEKEK